ncbi:MAG: hypothetical protein JSS79_02470 [Bacteroidetes bacterium]|nr:hypothetical protein [Bacteroidota bacterium]
MKTLRLIVVLVSGYFISVNATAQDSLHQTQSATQNAKPVSASKYVGYFFAVQAGTLIGCSSCDQGKDVTFSGSTVHGLTIGRKLRAGLGVGIDSYQNWQTLPVFFMASWDVIGNKNKNALFLQMTYGAAHPWFVRNGVYATYMYDPYSKVSGGRMINPQLGYRIKYHDVKLAFAVGYKFQRIFYSSNYYQYWGCPACDFVAQPISTTDITQDMTRVQLSMSVGWK